MRVAAIYGIHGNLPTLEAALAVIERVGPDLILVGGDVAAGPMPGATLDRLMALGDRARFLRGNADREVVATFDRIGDAPDVTDDPVQQVAYWSAAQLTQAHRDFLAAFPGQQVVEIARLGPVRFCHGSPRSDEEIITAATSESRLRPMLAGGTEPLIVCGHTHMQFDRRVAGTRVINAGSVGMPYEGRPGAYWVLLGPDVAFQYTNYDLIEAAAQVRATSYPHAEEFAEHNIIQPPTADEAIVIFESMAEADG